MTTYENPISPILQLTPTNDPDLSVPNLAFLWILVLLLSGIIYIMWRIFPRNLKDSIYDRSPLQFPRSGTSTHSVAISLVDFDLSTASDEVEKQMKPEIRVTDKEIEKLVKILEFEKRFRQQEEENRVKESNLMKELMNNYAVEKQEEQFYEKGLLLIESLYDYIDDLSPNEIIEIIIEKCLPIIELLMKDLKSGILRNVKSQNILWFETLRFRDLCFTLLSPSNPESSSQFSDDIELSEPTSNDYFNQNSNENPSSINRKMTNDQCEFFYVVIPVFLEESYASPTYNSINNSTTINIRALFDHHPIQNNDFSPHQQPRQRHLRIIHDINNLYWNKIYHITYELANRSPNLMSGAAKTTTKGRCLRDSHLISDSEGIEGTPKRKYAV